MYTCTYGRCVRTQYRKELGERECEGEGLEKVEKHMFKLPKEHKNVEIITNTMAWTCHCLNNNSPTSVNK